MTTTPARRSRPSARQLVTRILEEPALARAVQALEPRVLGRLIDHVGLEDAGELVALATTEQLAGVFDEDLWRGARPGEEETFDGERFAVWLEILVEIGETFAARKLVELPEDLVAHALQTRVLVVDLDALALEMADRAGEDEVEMLEKALEGTLHIELDRWRVVARGSDGWDALASVLLVADEQDHDFVERLLERLAFVSGRDVDDGGGLYQVLTGEQTLAVDAAAEREDRRSRAGYVAPAQAAAFLKMARRDGLGGVERDPVTRAYFRELDRAPRAAAGETPQAAPSPVTPLVEILRQADVLEAPRARLPGRVVEPAAGSRLRLMLGELAGEDVARYTRLTEELAYLANVLVAGLDVGRPLRPLEATEVALAVCELGLDSAGAAASADRWFRAGWSSLPDERAFVRRLVGSPTGSAPDPGRSA